MGLHSLIDGLKSYGTCTDSVIFTCYQTSLYCSLAEVYHKRLGSLGYNEGHAREPISLHHLRESLR